MPTTTIEVPIITQSKHIIHLNYRYIKKVYYHCDDNNIPYWLEVQFSESLKHRIFITKTIGITLIEFLKKKNPLFDISESYYKLSSNEKAKVNENLISFLIELFDLNLIKTHVLLNKFLIGESRLKCYNLFPNDYTLIMYLIEDLKGNSNSNCRVVEITNYFKSQNEITAEAIADMKNNEYMNNLYRSADDWMEGDTSNYWNID